MINIEESPYSIVKLFAGVYSDDNGEYNFSIDVECSENIYLFHTDIYWTDDKPDGDINQIEEEIKSKLINSNILSR
jgi:hypothetical protein